MPYLVDGHNLLGQTPGLSLSVAADRQRLIGTLSDFARRRRCSITVIFDGEPPAGWSAEMHYGRVAVRHAGSKRSGDEALLDSIRRSKAPGDIVLVTSDKQLYERARHLGARALAGHKFREMMAAAGGRTAGAEKPDRSDPEEIRQFLELFGAEDEEAPSRSRRRR